MCGLKLWVRQGSKLTPNKCKIVGGFCVRSVIFKTTQQWWLHVCTKIEVCLCDMVWPGTQRWVWLHTFSFITLKYSTWINVLCYMPSLLTTILCSSRFFSCKYHWVFWLDKLKLRENIKIQTLNWKCLVEAYTNSYTHAAVVWLNTVTHHCPNSLSIHPSVIS